MRSGFELVGEDGNRGGGAVRAHREQDRAHMGFSAGPWQAGRHPSGRPAAWKAKGGSAAIPGRRDSSGNRMVCERVWMEGPGCEDSWPQKTEGRGCQG